MRQQMQNLYFFLYFYDDQWLLQEGSQLHNKEDYNYFSSTEEGLVRQIQESLNLETFNDDQTIKDEYTGLIEAFKNECFLSRANHHSSFWYKSLSSIPTKAYVGGIT